MHAYIGRIKEAISQLVNACCGGYPDEMVSARSHRTGGWLENVIDAVLGVGHCELMYRRELDRKGQHPGYRDEEERFS
jgi:hypothetical protein